MLTFIELQGFSKRRQVLLQDDEFRAFQEILINDPRLGTQFREPVVFVKFAGVVPGWGSAAVYE